MENFNWMTLVDYIVPLLTTVILPFLVAGNEPTGIVRVVNWLKGVLNVSGNGARMLVGVVSVILAVVLAFVDGALTQDVFVDPTQFAATVAVLVAASQYWYNKLPKDNGAEVPIQ